MVSKTIFKFFHNNRKALGQLPNPVCKWGVQTNKECGICSKDLCKSVLPVFGVMEADRDSIASEASFFPCRCSIFSFVSFNCSCSMRGFISKWQPIKITKKPWTWCSWGMKIRLNQSVRSRHSRLPETGISWSQLSRVRAWYCTMLPGQHSFLPLQKNGTELITAVAAVAYDRCRSYAVLCMSSLLVCILIQKVDDTAIAMLRSSPARTQLVGRDSWPLISFSSAGSNVFKFYYLTALSPGDGED